MFDKYLICENSLRNITQGGGITGFEFDVRITSYRGLALSMVEGFDVNVDGERFNREDNTFLLRGKAYSFEQMEMETEVRWEMGEKATLRVPRPGGLSSGDHTIQVIEYLRISYVPVISEGKDEKTLTLRA